MIDVDGFNVSASKVAALHAAGLKVVLSRRGQLRARASRLG
jgi:hypothetical protein